MIFSAQNQYIQWAVELKKVNLLLPRTLLCLFTKHKLHLDLRHAQLLEFFFFFEKSLISIIAEG